MNMHIAGLTPTQRTAIARHQSFKASIEARAAALAHRNRNAALEALCVVAREAPLSHSPSIQAVVPEAMPAETDPPTWFIISEPKRSDYPSIRDIQNAVCKHFGVTLIDMLSGRRSAWIARPRQVAYFLCKELTLHSLPQIGRRFGGRDHSSVHHGMTKIKYLCPRDAALAQDIAILTEAITGVQQ